MSSPHRAAEFPVAPDTPTPKRPLGQRLLAVCLVLVVLALALLGARYLLSTKPQAKKRPPARMEVLVRVEPLNPADQAMRIRAMGSVHTTILDLKPRTEGTVAALHPAFFQGGQVRKGEILVTLDDTDHRLAVVRARNALQRAAMDLRIEEGNQLVAKREFALIGELSAASLANAQEDLALRQPQLAKAKAAEAIARTELEQAELSLARTRVEMPFDAVILDDQAAIGAQVNTQTPVARLAATGSYYVLASLPESELVHFTLPVDGRPGAQVTIRPAGVTDAKIDVFWRGEVESLAGAVEESSLMARVLIRVPEPLGPDPAHHLLLGSAVEASIAGNTLKGVYRLPRHAVRADGSVLLAAQDNTLEIRFVESIWQERDWIYAQGLHPGERLIITPVPAPVTGMPLRLAGEKAQEADPVAGGA